MSLGPTPKKNRGGPQAAPVGMTLALGGQTYFLAIFSATAAWAAARRAIGTRNGEQLT